MATPKKKRGFRPVVVDGHRYNWRVGEPNRTADLEIYRELDDRGRGKRLCVNFKCDVTLPITGRMVSKIIRCALTEGWQPTLAGGDCALDLIDANAESPVRMAVKSHRIAGTANSPSGSAEAL